MKEIINEFIDLLLKSDRYRATKLLIDWGEENGYRELLNEVVEPMLLEIGEMWNRDLSLAHGYLAGKIVEEVLIKFRDKIDFSKYKSKGTIVIGNTEDDYHSLGRKLVAIFLEANDWKVIDLGNDVLAEEFVDVAQKENADIIASSAMMYTNAKNMIKVREVLDKRGLSGKIMYAVGGAVFIEREELLNEVGADGTAKNAIDAIELMEKLLKKRGELNE